MEDTKSQNCKSKVNQQRNLFRCSWTFNGQSPTAIPSLMALIILDIQPKILVCYTIFVIIEYIFIRIQFSILGQPISLFYIKLSKWGENGALLVGELNGLSLIYKHVHKPSFLWRTLQRGSCLFHIKGKVHKVLHGPSSKEFLVYNGIQIIIILMYRHVH